MALTVTHSFVSAVADSSTASAAGKVLPTEWNAPHTVSGNLPVSQLDSGIAASAATYWRGDGTWSLTPPSSSGVGVSTALGIVNVKDFGATGDGVTDDSAAIQAAIDYAIANSIRTIYVPDGGYRTTKTIFVDAPDSVRGIGVIAAWAVGTSYSIGNKVRNNGMVWISLTNANLGNTPELQPGPNFTVGGNWSVSVPSVATGKFVFWEPSFSTPTHGEMNLAFVGSPGQGATGAHSRLLPNFNNAPGVIMGDGNGMLIAHLGVYGGGGALGNATDGGTANYNVYGFAYRTGRGFPTQGVGIAIAGTGAASRMWIEKCQIQAWEYGIFTGYCGDGLGDSNTIKDTFIYDCTTGVDVRQTQNFINRMETCTIHCRINVSALVSTGVGIAGGHYSTVNERAPSCSFLVSSITYLNDNQISVVLGVADPLTFDSITMLDYVKNGMLTHFIAETVHFGYVPFTPASFDNGTSTITLSLDPRWSTDSGGIGFTNLTLSAAYDLMTEISACTKFYAAMAVEVFRGTGINVEDVHVENGAATIFFRTNSGFGQPRPCSARGVIFNASLGYQDYISNPADQYKALWLVQSSIPFISLEQASLLMECCDMPFTATNGNFNVDCIADSTVEFKIINCHGFTFNGRATGGPVEFGINSEILGNGESSVSPYVAKVTRGTEITDAGGPLWIQALGQAPTWGVRPAPFATPMIHPNQLQAIMGSSLPPLTLTANQWIIAYPPLWGGQMYHVDASVLSSNAGYTAPPAHRQLMSQHYNGYSYGQNLAVTWNCKGQSAFINVDDISLMFPGLGVQITTDATRTYTVKGVYSDMQSVYPAKQAGYLYVYRRDAFATGVHAPIITGGSTTVYGSTSLGQEAFNIKYFDDTNHYPTTVVTLPSAATNTGARFVVSDANATTFYSIVTGGSTNTVPVISDGTNWRIG